jgi:predicted alpha/beta-hydrolase family hydrolase
MRVHLIEIDYGEGVTSGRVAGSGESGLPTMIFAHGAGTNQDHPLMTALRDGLAQRGVRVVTFNYAYAEAGRRGPDRHERLLTVHGAALDWTLNNLSTDVVLGGRSMGGRIATHLVTERPEPNAVVLFAYPLHPVGKPERLRSAHLVEIDLPMLFLTGTRDGMATRALMEEHVAPLPNANIVYLDDVDHSYRIPKRSGRTQEDVIEEVLVETVRFLTEFR